MDMGYQWQCKVCHEWSDVMGGHTCTKMIVDRAEHERLAASEQQARALSEQVRRLIEKAPKVASITDEEESDLGIALTTYYDDGDRLLTCLGCGEVVVTDEPPRRKWPHAADCPWLAILELLARPAGAARAGED